MIYQIIQPHPALKPLVKEYMLVHFNFTGFVGERPSKLLEARAEQSIILYPSGQFAKINPTVNKRLVIPPTIVQGQLLTGWYHHYPEDFKFVKIIFQPGGLFHLLGQAPTTYFTDAVTDAESVLGREMTEIIQQLMNTEQYVEMIRAVDTYLLTKFRKLKLHIEPIDRINHLLQNPKTGLNLDYLADQACVSYRQFERKFKERNGVSPKLFVRIARFNRAYTMKQEKPEKDWLDVAVSCGYSDYQHMVKDFKQFAGVTPVAMLEAEAKCPEKVLGLHKDVVFLTTAAVPSALVLLPEHKQKNRMETASRRSAIKSLSAAIVNTILPHSQEVNASASTPEKAFVIREAEGRFNELYHIMGFELSLKVSGKDTNEQLSMYFGTYKKNDGPPLHVHYKQDEQFYIVDGEILFQVGTEKYTLKSGDTIFLPRNVPHAFLVLSETGRLFFQTNPSGKTEAFFKKLSQLGPKASLDDVQKLHLAHDLSIVGPPLKA